MGLFFFKASKTDINEIEQNVINNPLETGGPLNDNPIIRDREYEELFLKGFGSRKIQPDAITNVMFKLNIRDKEIRINFFTLIGNPYDIFIKVQDFNNLTWKESQCICCSLKMASRGSIMNNQIFQNWVEVMTQKFFVVQVIENKGTKYLIINPENVTVNIEHDTQIKRTSISFTEFGDIRIISQSNQFIGVFIVRILSQSSSLSMGDCKVLQEILQKTEIGDKNWTLETFNLFAKKIEFDFNYIVKKYNNSKKSDESLQYCEIITCSEYLNKEDLKEINFEKERENEKRIRQKQELINSIYPKSKKLKCAYGNYSHELTEIQVQYSNNSNNNNREEKCSLCENKIIGEIIIFGCKKHKYFLCSECKKMAFGFPNLTFKKMISKFSSQGNVYLGKWNDSEVAIKVFNKSMTMSNDNDEESRNDWKIELRSLLKSGNHPNVIEVLDFFEYPMPCLVMPYINGETLFNYLNETLKGKKLEREHYLSLSIQISEGSAYLHKCGYVHRDLKSLNILLDETKTKATIIDLGMSAEFNIQYHNFNNIISFSKTSRDGYGTDQWVAPEMFRERKFSDTADTYSFGIVLWELISSKIPYDGIKFNPEIKQSIISGRLRPSYFDVAHGGEDLYKLMCLCWRSEYKERPKMNQIVQILKQISKNEKVYFERIFSNNNNNNNNNNNSELLKSQKELDLLSNENIIFNKRPSNVRQNYNINNNNNYYFNNEQHQHQHQQLPSYQQQQQQQRQYSCQQEQYYSYQQQQRQIQNQLQRASWDDIPLDIDVKKVSPKWREVLELSGIGPYQLRENSICIMNTLNKVVQTSLLTLPNNINSNNININISNNINSNNSNRNNNFNDSHSRVDLYYWDPIYKNLKNEFISSLKSSLRVVN